MKLNDLQMNCLCSHYQSTYENHKSTVKQRDMLFYGLLIIVALFTLQFSSVETLSSMLNQYCDKSIGFKLGASVEFVSTLLWLLLLGICLKYFQLVIEIERQYNYIHSLENEINSIFENSIAFTREGKSYLDNYPMFLNWVYFLYTILFPILLIVLFSFRITVEVKNAQIINANMIPPLKTVPCES